MRYIDHTNCKTAFEKGEDHEIQSLGKLTRTATKIAEANGLGVLKNRQGYYRIIKKSGLGAYGDVLSSLAEVDAFFKNLDSHKATVTLTNRQLDTTFFEGSMRDIPDHFSNCIVEAFCVSNTGDFLFKIKVNPVPANEEKRLWHEGSLRVHGSIFHYWFKQYDEGSEFGIDGGRISKLMLKRNGEIVCNYDRGWDVQPVDEDTQFAYEILVHTENF